MPTREPVLTWRHRNRAVLARQRLLERATVALPTLLGAVAGIQAQYAPSMYIGLWSRLAAFDRQQLTTALERKRVVQGTLLRSTIHLVRPADWWVHGAAVRDERRRWFLASRRGTVTDAELRRAAAGLRRRLEADGPLPRREVEAIVGKPLVEGVGLWLDLVRVPPSGTWDRRRADLLGLADTWLRPPDPAPDPVEARRALVRAYLAAFGPATVAEIGGWAGLPVKAVEAALDGQRLRRFRDEGGRSLVDVPGAPLPDPGTPAPVRFLPTWDATLLAHCRQARIITEEHRPRIFHTRNPQSSPTFLVDGTVAGTWRHDHGRIELEPFDRLPRAVAAEVRAEADLLLGLFG